jgi:hypothetical protein
MASTVFFEDASGAPAVGKAALDELGRWGRFQIVPNKTQADLILVLSASPQKAVTSSIPAAKRAPSTNQAPSMKTQFPTITNPHQSGPRISPSSTPKPANPSGPTLASGAAFSPAKTPPEPASSLS